jgi:hypothetical protein
MTHPSNLMKTKTVPSLFALACRIVLLFACMCGTLSATIYYVDSAGGSDANNGTSTSTPWQTLAKVNATTFAAGDQILFKAGSSWTGTTKLNPKGSGTAGNPIKIDLYGTGAKPIINAGTATGNGAVYLSNQQYWEISNLEIINNSTSDGDRRGVHMPAPRSTTSTSRTATFMTSAARPAPATATFPPNGRAASWWNPPAPRRSTMIF